VGTHAPFWHVSFDWHARPHEPQWPGSVRSETQLFAQRTCSALQTTSGVITASFTAPSVLVRPPTTELPSQPATRARAPSNNPSNPARLIIGLLDFSGISRKKAETELLGFQTQGNNMRILLSVETDRMS
jgi:hypothetical protein